MLFISLTPCLWADAPNGGLDSLTKAVGVDVQAANYASALEKFREANPAELAENECKTGSGRYCVTNGFSRDLPGINEKTSITNILHDSKNYIAIPGTSDTASREHELEFQTVAENFAFQYNLHAQYWNEAIGHKVIGAVSLDNTRLFIELPTEVWDRLPVSSKLRIRYLAELADEETKR